MSKNNPIDQHFCEHLQDVDVQPDSDLWPKIKPRLDDRSGRRGWYYGIAASVALAIAVSSYIYDTYQPVEPSVLPITQDPTEEIKPAATPPAEEIQSPEVEEETERPTEVNHIAVQNKRREGGTLPEAIDNRIMPEIIGQDAGASARRQTALNNEPGGEDNTRTLADATPEFGVKVKIDPERYLQTRAAAALETNPADSAGQKMALGDYAEQQFNNLINGKDIVTPRKGQIRWPEVSINLSPIIQKFTPDRDHSSTQH